MDEGPGVVVKHNPARGDDREVMKREIHRQHKFLTEGPPHP